MSKENNQKKVHQPDDKLIKQVLREKQNAQAYLKKFHPEIVEIIEIDQLSIQPESFLTPEFDLFESDIVYRCPFKNSNEQLYLSLIWENKLHPSKWVAIQLGLYIFLALDKMVKEKGRKVEPILPLLFYNGKEDWTPQTINDLFKGHPYFKNLKQYLPSFAFLFKNIVDEPIEELLKIERAFLRSALIAMANRHDFDLIIQNFNAIFDLEEKYQEVTIATYIFGIANKTKTELKNIVNSLKSSGKNEKFMSTLEMLLKEGEEIGIKKGEEIGIKKGEAIQKLLATLRLIKNLPTFSAKEIANLAAQKEEHIILLINSLKLKKRKDITKIIDKHFLTNIKLNRSEKSKITKAITSVIKA